MPLTVSFCAGTWSTTLLYGHRQPTKLNFAGQVSGAPVVFLDVTIDQNNTFGLDTHQRLCIKMAISTGMVLWISIQHSLWLARMRGWLAHARAGLHGACASRSKEKRACTGIRCTRTVYHVRTNTRTAMPPRRDRDPTPHTRRMQGIVGQPSRGCDLITLRKNCETWNVAA